MAWYNRFTKAAPDRKPNDLPSRPQTIYLRSGLAVAVVKWGDGIAVKQAMAHPIVGRALNKIAESVQQMRWFAELDPEATPADRANKTTVIASINDLLRSPHPDLTPQQLRYWLALNYASYGRVPFKVGYSAVKRGTPNGIYPLDTDQVRAKMDARGAIAGYEYGSGEAMQPFKSRARWDGSATSGYVAEVWKPGISASSVGTANNTPLATVGLPAQVITSLLTRAIQTAEGHPNARYMVTCSKTLTTSQLETLTDYLEGFDANGPDAGGIPVLQNAADVEIHTLSNDLSDIHSKMPSDDMARLIFGAFGIPLGIAGIGAADAAKFTGNFDSSVISFWQDTIIPGYVSPIFQQMTKALCPQGVRISADLDSIPALLNGRVSAMANMEKINFLTTTEKRELMGWAPTTALPENPNATETPTP